MILKRSDIMRRLADAAVDGMPNFESLCEKLDQLEDPAFWAWWQENERERHMRANGWKETSGRWKKVDDTKLDPGVKFDNAWNVFRIEYGVKTALPMMPILLAFDPTKQEGLKDVLNNSTAWTLWLLWKARHIVSQHFNNECIRVAMMIDRNQPKTVEDLTRCFSSLSPTSNFLGSDADKFCAEALPFFTGEREVEIVINPPPAKHPMIP